MLLYDALSRAALIFYKWSNTCRRRSEVILRSKVVVLPPQRSSAPERPKPRELDDDAKPSLVPNLGTSTTSSQSNRHTDNARSSAGANVTTESANRTDSCGRDSALSLEGIEPTLTEIVVPSPTTSAYQTPRDELAMSREPATGSLSGQGAPSASRSPPSSPQDGTCHFARDSPKKDKLTLNIPSTERRASPSRPFPLSPSMMSPHTIPFTRHPQFARHMKPIVQEWGFTASIRKKKLPLNKYGLPDVSADQLEKDTPEQRIIEQMRKAFRDLTEEKLVSGWDDGSGFEYVIDLFSQLLDLICSFVNQRLGEKFRKTLDIDMHKQMVMARVYTPEEFQKTLKLCVGLLYELESPYQHGLTKEWWSGLKYDYATKEEYALAICDSIMYLFRKCDLCKMEVENYYISRISPADRQNQERAAFEKIPLPLYVPWDCSTKQLFLEGLITKIADYPTKLTESLVTSCLALDLTTLHQFQNTLQEATVLGVMSVVLSKIFATFEADHLEEFFESVLSAYAHKQGPDVIFNVLKTRIPEKDHAGAKEACAQIIKCADLNDPLYKILRDRVVNFIVNADASPDVLGRKPAHLCFANQRAHDLKFVFCLFVEEHWQVYGPVYTK